MPRLPLLPPLLALATALALGAGGCVDPLDLRLPIALVPDADFSASQAQIIGEAAESWNVEVGVRMGLQGQQVPDAQQVPIRQSELACAYANGITVTLGELEVQICALDAGDPRRLAEVTQHELGHVLNIRGHAVDPLAVMSPESGESKRFRPEDHQLFEQANPDFSELDGCDVARRLGQSPSRPVLVQLSGGRTVALWAEPGRLRYAQLDFETARPGGATGQIATPGGTASWIRPLATSDGFSVSWVLDQRLYRASVALPGGKLTGPLELALPQTKTKLDFEAGVSDISTAAVGPDVFVAITDGGLFSELRLLRYDAATGLPRPIAPNLVDDSWGQLATLGDQLYLVTRQALGLRVDRLDAAGNVLESLPLSIQAPRGDLDALQAQVIDGALLVASRLAKDPVRIYRVVRAADGALRLDRTALVKLPPGGGHTLLSLAGTSCGLGLGLNQAAGAVHDVYVTVLDPVTLKVDRPWKRLSAPDRTQSVQPWLAAQHCRFLAIWRDMQSSDEIDIRSRCF